ncbi:hypothetical protein V9T40_010529 [Parthenolecanium corni]|uniref:Uncharacterized protein n=1 Tax=Parthenolecanium corni TaxID=536013 RepID=A0AAN9T3R2_9HEMI
MLDIFFPHGYCHWLRSGSAVVAVGRSSKRKSSGKNFGEKKQQRKEGKKERKEREKKGGEEDAERPIGRKNNDQRDAAAVSVSRYAEYEYEIRIQLGDSDLIRSDPIQSDPWQRKSQPSRRVASRRVVDQHETNENENKNKNKKKKRKRRGLGWGLGDRRWMREIPRKATKMAPEAISFSKQQSGNGTRIVSKTAGCIAKWLRSAFSKETYSSLSKLSANMGQGPGYAKELRRSCFSGRPALGAQKCRNNSSPPPPPPHSPTNSSRSYASAQPPLREIPYYKSCSVYLTRHSALFIFIEHSRYVLNGPTGNKYYDYEYTRTILPFYHFEFQAARTSNLSSIEAASASTSGLRPEPEYEYASLQ